MAIAQPPSFGRDLPDQLNRIQNVVHDQIAFYGDVRDYFKERVALERQYGASLQLLVRKAMDKRTKREEALSVGLETSKPWNGTSSTLDTAWSKILSEADEEASDHTNLAESLQNEVCEVLKTCEKKKEATRKRHVEFGVKLLAERDKIYHDRAKAKQRYDEACSLVESTRVKQGQAKDDRHVEKAAKNMDVHTNDMLSAKNAYLLSISVANEVKRRFYHVDLPSLEDDFQSIWSLTASKLVSLLKSFSTLNGRCLDALRTHNENFLAATNTIDAQSNQALYIEYNRRPFTDPPDFVFEPCPIWHDSAEFALSAPEPKVLLQNRLGQARSKATDLEPTIGAKRHEITGLENLREAYSKNESLGDPDEVVENLLESVRQTITLELQYSVLTKEVEVLEQTLGDDQGSQRPHNFKSASFVTPTSCCLCNSNIWGITKQGVTCKACSISAHVKCGPKVPSNCAGSAPLKRNVSLAAPSASDSRQQGVDPIPREPQNQSGLSRAVSTSTRPAAVSNGGGLARAATTINKTAAPPINRNALHRSEPKARARMIYGYEASSGFEVSASESEVVTVVSPDDGSGWIKVETSSNQIGLVPATYVEIVPTDAATPSSAPPRAATGPTPVPTRLKRAKALYNWNAQAPDEHSLSVGETVTLSKGGEAYGGGWYEIIKDSRKGIVPSNYVELL
ncbi:hypothetical protein PTTG_12168 [Puccinia triticina 1-1 BBBD Race 1]|uniref:Uncharacterized protein n=2 Tax=Puccinia triticina TaxID=208348 RepID=A0A180G894_PUCT1|nr:uncharacterized protein PtA15_6A119 [Puccinia triticina]OAV88834.1 hypothetical protein PTTG_12168 [Puccinia triticina 1-1 BBBD Race 1]WAQ85491.1 hypothetical protein PtA15_6A119 [Puccinia triticina]WAR55373.1 hypothetical protein PtB15_6B113 [Puccinia triticina]